MRRGRKRLAVAAVYLLALAASHLVRWQRPSRPAPPPDVAVVDLEQSISTASGNAPLRLAYREWSNDNGSAAGERSTILLLHGSPGTSRDFRRFAPLLAADHRVLAPDLPGFGDSSHEIADYSIAAHAEDVAALLTSLDTGAVHVVGYSMGGGVALELAARHPEQVLSVTLLSSIGVQELELLGSYLLNHGVHALQLAAIWTLHEVVPHFCLLDGFPLDVPYARNFYDSDQRPLRGILQRLAMPVLVVHGERDFLVPVAAAREHHRLVPQSELRVLDGDHFMVFRADPRLAAAILDFVHRVDEGRAVRRSQATAERLAAAREPFDPTTIPPAEGVTLAVLLGLIALATFISEDATCMATGLLIAQGRLGFLAGSGACALGILVGDLLIYAAGRFLGRPWLPRAPLKWIVTPRSLARAEEWFARRGPAVILSSRFLPGTRVATYFSAGLLGASFGQFLLYFLIAVALWTPLLVGLSAWLGGQLAETFAAFERWALPGAIAVALAASLLFSLTRSLSTWRGRRRLLGALRRKLEWEFWPWWLIYAPVYPWILGLGLRYRSPTLFTAANPGIEAGGFVGESKAAILGSLDARWVARFALIRAAEAPLDRLDAARRFIAREGLSFPLVVKPDVGQRGAGFTKVRDEGELERTIAAIDEDVLVQEFIGGVELGIFYARLPSTAHGRIISITEKKLLTLTGDGSSTLEDLILRDERAMRMAPIHLDKMADRLLEVPAGGTEVPLVEMGVHSRGALFLDGARLQTEALEAAVDEISRSFDGFFFGRYDMRAPSTEAFRRGADLTVLELNGVTSESTHIYDPGNSYADAVRILCRQWHLAFRIGAKNRDRGVSPAGIAKVARLAVRYFLPRR